MEENKTAQGCEKYEKAITHYVVGEEMGLTKEELFEHLKTCPNCRRDLTEWRDTYTVMKTEAYYETPEGQAKMKRSFEDLKRQLAAVSRPGDTKQEIISASERIDHFVATLKPDEKVFIPEMREKLGLVRYPFWEGLTLSTMAETVRVEKDEHNQPTYVLPLKPRKPEQPQAEA